MLHRIECFRNAFALASHNDRQPHATVAVLDFESRKTRLFCSCSKGNYATCNHAQQLRESGGFDSENNFEHTELWNSFLSSACWRFFQGLAQHSTFDVQRLDVRIEDDQNVTIESAQGPLAWFTVKTASGKRLLSRLQGASSADRFSRYDLFRRMERLVVTPAERQLIDAGHITAGLAQQRGLWGRLAYHCFCEAQPDKLSVQVAYDTSYRGFVIRWHNGQEELFRAGIIHSQSFGSVKKLMRLFPEAHLDFSLQDEGEIKFRFENLQKETVHVHPCVQIASAKKEDTLCDLSSGCVVGTALYLPHYKHCIGFSAQSCQLLAKHWHVQKKVASEQFSAFLQQHAADFSLQHSQDLFGTIAEPDWQRCVNLRIEHTLDSIHIEPIEIFAEGCRAQLRLAYGSITIGLAEVLNAFFKGNRYVIGRGGVVELTDPQTCQLCEKGAFAIQNDQSVFISRPRLVWLKHSGIAPVTMSGDPSVVTQVELVCNLAVHRPLKKLTNLKSKLRRYQSNGVKWLLNLYDNYLGGILADEMGLGKTHQSLGLFCALQQQRDVQNPILVICPTTVMSHWEALLSHYAPTFSVTVYHGANRQLPPTNSGASVIIASYGVLRNDTELLEQRVFSVVVFDEIQSLKNRHTQSAQAAFRLQARLRIGLTGTPVENSPRDVKTLIDICVTGFLGSEAQFQQQYVEPIESGDTVAMKRLQQKISPFILRRLKSSVLKQLPERIYDTRTCVLTEQQKALYDHLMQTRGGRLVSKLKDSSSNIPYTHIFALMNYLKQLCNHPLTLQDTFDISGGETSAKWELFCEIVQECLESDQKVVVFTQYLKMMDIICSWLTKQKIGWVQLRGSTTKRGEVVGTFQNDPKCKVFVGSLKASGVGVDLTAASAVIHYDRWWNAAVEDQATDRVHRIGQKKAVQVFRLITRNTLEERINEIILRKRMVSDQVLPEDSAKMLKVFSREQLLHILQTQ